MILSRGETRLSTPTSVRTEKPERRKLFIKSYGCQMNVYDATRMADVLAPEGYEETTDMAEADLVVLNTCHIRERAADKVFSELGKVRLLKEERASREIGRAHV